MLEQKFRKPDYLFEVSWEVCNKVGGIYTVISTKAITLQNQLKDNYILIGPDVWKETRNNPEFLEDRFLFRSWREEAERAGLRFKIGRWNISGNPIAILVDFTPYFAIKDKIFKELWEKYYLDSLSGQWDYVEPALFGYASAKIIESFYDYFITGRDKVIAQFHEWMTGSGILYLKDRIPQIGNVFTTHATAMARSIAGNGMPLYSNIETYSADNLSKEFGIVSKQSLEKLSAKHADCFTTVSEITAKECKYFLGKPVDFVTPNGFEDTFVPEADVFEEKRSEARARAFKVAEAIVNQKLEPDSMLVGISGRYEYKNKGIDLFIKSLGILNKDAGLGKKIIAFIMVPANQAGARREVIERMENPDFAEPITNEYLSHYLHDAELDPVLRALKANGIDNAPDSNVKVIFAPSYLNGVDGIFNLSYFEFIIGFDVTVFPSYYEPWGYTPMESLAFKIPTITTTLAGFGMWVNQNFGKLDEGVAVIERDDNNDEYVVSQITLNLLKCSNRSAEAKQNARNKAYEISRAVLWSNFIKHYLEAYSDTLNKVSLRKELFRSKQVPEHIALPSSIAEANKPVWKKMMVKSEFPDGLSSLVKLSRNLWWCWNYEASELFQSIDSDLWEQCSHNPVALLDMLSYDQLLNLEKDIEFLLRLEKVYTKFHNYMIANCDKPEDQIAYFSMEFGLHDSVKIFSGGLGVLAGDYLKQASDSNVNLVGIGLLYRYGYFKQNLSFSGEQLEAIIPQRFTHLPIQPVRTGKSDNPNNGWLKIKVALPGRTLYAKVWKIDVGRVPLYLLDTDIEENIEADKSITYQLYGGDWENRLKQELLLGVGGIRLLDALGLSPQLFHCNEGHAAFIGLERLRKFVQDDMFTFNEASEIVRASTLFTTHTPVPAGHDAFSEDLLRAYIPHYAERLNIGWETFMNLGRYNENDLNQKFSMSVLAAKLSQEINGVSRIHGRVTREMFCKMWEGYFPDELHIGYVTNGVHYPTWTSKYWRELYEETFGPEFMDNLSDKEYWRKIFHISDDKVWKIRQNLRKELIDYIKERATDSLAKRLESPKIIVEIIDTLNENALTIGFARRFATYKRAHLLFTNLEKLSKILNNPEKPVQFIFAGKAHPQDKAGQDLIKRIIEVSRMKEFIGKIIFLENYDMQLATKLVQGVDIWLNTPTRPLEASGTSGQKAVMNGVVNFSVLDGWWAEGYIEKAGWALKEENTFENPDYQDQLDAETIYDIIEDEIVPLFYKRDKQNIPTKWISYVKNTIAEIAPQFTTKRMIDDYMNKYYTKMFERSRMLNDNDYELVKKLSAWKKKVIRAWNGIAVVSVDTPDSSKKPFKLGEKFVCEVTLDLNELLPGDIGIEVVFGQKEMDVVKNVVYKKEMDLYKHERNIATFRIEIFVTRSGVFDYAFRVFPKHDLLPHRMDFNLVKWI